MVKVFLVDDHEVVRRGLVDLLSADDELEVIGEAGSVAQALARIPALQPDVAAMRVEKVLWRLMCIASMPRSPGADAADDRVEIGAVAIDRPPAAWTASEIVDHLGLEQAAGIGVGDHHAGDVGAEPRLQRREIDPARRVGRDVLDAVAGEGGGRRDWCRARFRGRGSLRARSPRASSAERIASRPHNSPCAPALGLIATECMPVSVDQPVGELVDQRIGALHRVGRLQRMDVGEARHPRHLLVEPRIVLHRARAEREQAEVDRVILAAEPGIMAHRLGLGEAGEADRRVALEAAEARRRRRSASRRNRRRCVSVSPISNSNGSSSISARLPVQVSRGLGAFGPVGRPRGSCSCQHSFERLGERFDIVLGDGLGHRHHQPVRQRRPRPDRAGRARRRRARHARPSSRTAGRASLGRRRVNSLKKLSLTRLDARHPRQPLRRRDRLARD